MTNDEAAAELADQLGETDAPVAPCADCAAVTQRQMAVAIALGVLGGAGLFYVITRYAH